MTANLREKSQIEVRVAGFGGQGVVLAGMVLGRAAAVEEGRNAVMAQSYGPESRGGASSAEVLIADGEIPYPHCVNPDVVVTLSQAAYDKYGVTRPASSLLIVEKDLVELDPQAEKGKRCLRVPFTALADKLGRRMVLNMVTLGFLCRATGVVTPDAMRKAIAHSVPKGTEDLNLSAFETGYGYTEGL
jgi:2-oxoglutarate ferredoxin oxidoreductase subunit gamma